MKKCGETINFSGRIDHLNFVPPGLLSGSFSPPLRAESQTLAAEYAKPNTTSCFVASSLNLARTAQNKPG